MLNMPALIQEWKQVSLRGARRVRLWVCANEWIERTRKGVEEVAEWEGEEIDGVVEIWLGGVQLCWEMCIRSYRHLQEAFGHMHYVVRSQSCVHRTLRIDFRICNKRTTRLPSMTDWCGGILANSKPS
jgi:hypothetical protein